MNREQAKPWVSYVVDDAGCGRGIGEDIHAIIRESGSGWRHASRLVGWQCGFEPLFIAVHSYMDVRLGDQEAEELAADYLAERGWFGDQQRRAADYILE